MALWDHYDILPQLKALSRDPLKTYPQQTRCNLSPVVALLRLMGQSTVGEE